MLDLGATITPHWHDGHFWVSHQLQGDPAAMDKISAVCLYMFRWRKFTESRWCSIGTCCRAVLCSLFVGLEQLVSLTRSDPKATDYHLHGFERLSKQIRTYIVVASIVNFVPESLLLEVSDDDRLARRCEELEGVLAEDLAWVESINEFTWIRLAAFAGSLTSAGQLRSMSIYFSHVAAGFINKRVFSVIRNYPWSLCIGDISTNLDILAVDTSEISDTCTFKIRALLKMGFNRVKLEQAIDVMREAPFSSIPVEQGHGSCAVMHRFHPLYTGHQLATRSMLHQARHLFTRPESELKLDKRAQRIHRLREKQPGKTSARHAFFSWFFVVFHSTVSSLWLSLNV